MELSEFDLIPMHNNQNVKQPLPIIDLYQIGGHFINLGC
jgi:hypothetical protein